jgi:hypothetical protein
VEITRKVKEYTKSIVLLFDMPFVFTEVRAEWLNKGR